MRVAIVHDDLVQWGGAERVLLAISEVFPDAPIYTSVFNSSNKLITDNFKDKQIRTSFLQKIPGWLTFYKALLPLYPIAFEQFDFSEYDLVISQTTRFANAIITKPSTKHICYIHTPPRFLWGFSGFKLNGVVSPYMSLLRLYDQIKSKSRVDKWLAGSCNCQERLSKIYRVDSQVLLPFVDDRFFDEIEGFDGGYFLVLGRLNSYKRIDLVVNAFNKQGDRVKIVGKGPEKTKLQNMAFSNIEFLEGVSDAILIKLLAGCRGLIVVAEEDFGLSPLEAQALGKPVIALRKGGALETVIEGKTGIFFDEQTEQSLTKAIEKFKLKKFNPEDCRNNARRFRKRHFQNRLKILIEKFI